MDSSFITYAADILGETDRGLSGSKIAEHCNSYAIDFDVAIPYPSYPFPPKLSNKRTALRENLQRFTPQQQFKIIKELCSLPYFEGNQDVKDLKIRLISRFANLALENVTEELNEQLLEQTRHWLEQYPTSLKLYQQALSKHNNEIFSRNCLDDLRLALETLLKEILSNKKSLENQTSELGIFLSQRQVSRELMNMFLKLVEYFAKYQNTYVKHDDAINDKELEIIIEVASSFMKFLVKIK